MLVRVHVRDVALSLVGHDVFNLERVPQVSANEVTEPFADRSPGTALGFQMGREAG